MDGSTRHMERSNMDEKTNTKESSKRQIDTNQPFNLVTLAPNYVNGARRSRDER